MVSWHGFVAGAVFRSSETYTQANTHRLRLVWFLYSFRNFILSVVRADGIYRQNAGRQPIYNRLLV